MNNMRAKIVPLTIALHRMIRFASLGVLLLLAVPLTSGAGEPKPIVASVGEEFEIALESPGGAGRVWLLSKPLDEQRVKQVGRELRRHFQTNAPPRVSEVFRYKALAEGKTEIHLRFGTLLEQERVPARNTNFVVMIRQPRTKVAK